MSSLTEEQRQLIQRKKAEALERRRLFLLQQEEEKERELALAASTVHSLPPQAFITPRTPSEPSISQPDDNYTPQGALAGMIASFYEHQSFPPTHPPFQPNFTVFHGEKIQFKKCTFQAHAARVNSHDDVETFKNHILSDPQVASATHNVLAYRFSTDPINSQSFSFLQG